MRQVSLLVLEGMCALCALVAGAWLVVVPLYLLSTGGTYGYAEGDTMLCGIRVFTEDNWLQMALLLFGLPLALLIISVKVVRRTARQLAFGRLP